MGWITASDWSDGGHVGWIIAPYWLPTHAIHIQRGGYVPEGILIITGARKEPKERRREN